MRYRQLGASDLEVSEISLGSWLTYGVGVEAEAARACLDRAFELGINFIDTANIYGRGAAETFLGEALAGRPRDSYILATKLFFPMTDSDRGLSARPDRKAARRLAAAAAAPTMSISTSATATTTDTPLEETMEALTRAVDSGKARYIGFSEWPADKIRAAIDMAGVDTLRLQPAAIFAALARAREGGDPALRRQRHLADRLVAARPGRAHRQIRARRAAARRQPRDQRGDGRLDGPPGCAPALLEAVQRLKPLAAEAGLSLAQFALAWVLREPNVASAIVGASRPAQVDENAAASGAEVDPALFAEAERIVARRPLEPAAEPSKRSGRRASRVDTCPRASCRTAGRAPSAPAIAS